MCFSAQASFAAAGALSIISLLSVNKVRNKKIIPLALTPLFFGIQQACEGFVWLTINNTTSIFHVSSVYLFLFFAGVFWPSWIPIMLCIAENQYKRKRLLFRFINCGIIISLLVFYYWILQTTGATIINHHIHYPVAYYPLSINTEFSITILTFLYCLQIIIPFFVSSIPYIKWLGLSTIGGALISYIFYVVAFPSVWCFFAAICSIFIYFIVKSYRM